MALSRIGLWSFDLIQVKQLQICLEEHPQRNTLYVTFRSWDHHIYRAYD